MTKTVLEEMGRQGTQAWKRTMLNGALSVRYADWLRGSRTHAPTGTGTPYYSSS